METLKYPTRTKAFKNHECMFCCQPITKGSYYLRSTHKYDVLYTFKTHEVCQVLAEKLRMYDEADEGVTTDIFVETVKEEYSRIMSEHHNQVYESKDFILPKFSERLAFVLGRHGL